jgi:hypothetical protein
MDESNRIIQLVNNNQHERSSCKDAKAQRKDRLLFFAPLRRQREMFKKACHCRRAGLESASPDKPVSKKFRENYLYQSG